MSEAVPTAPCIFMAWTGTGLLLPSEILFIHCTYVLLVRVIHGVKPLLFIYSPELGIVASNSHCTRIYVCLFSECCPVQVDAL